MIELTISSTSFVLGFVRSDTTPILSSAASFQALLLEGYARKTMANGEYTVKDRDELSIGFTDTLSPTLSQLRPAFRPASPICDSYVRPATLVRICEECNFGSSGGKCIICGGQGVSVSTSARP